MAYGYAYTLLGDAYLAEDAAQEAFLTAYRMLPQLREPKAFSGWLRRIVHSQCHRLLRRQRLATQSLETTSDLIADQPSPQTILEHLELEKAVRATIQSLPEAHQAPVDLYYLGNYSQSEIAQLLNLSVAAVKKRLERARFLLEERMHGMAQEHLGSMARASAGGTSSLSSLMDAAAEEGQFVLLETLLVEGMDVNEQDANGQTMVHWAASQGHLEALDMLLTYHPDLNRRDRSGRTALQLAVEGGHRQAADRLRQVAQDV
jgi:RNA polymerase sigma factor (sigma-70 family)